MSGAEQHKPQSVEQARAAALDMQRQGYDLQLIADVLRVDVDALKRLIGGPCQDCD